MGRNPEFRTVEEDLKAEQEQIRRDEEEARRRAEREVKRDEVLAPQLRQFVVSRGRLRAVRVVCNIKTGQAAAATELDRHDRYSKEWWDVGYYQWDEFQRIRAAEALRLIHTGNTSLSPVSTVYGLVGLEFPSWLFTATDEPPARWDWVMVKVKWWSAWYGLKSLCFSLYSLVRLLLIALLWLVMIGLGVYGLSFFISGVAGLLEFGRKQL